jgi:hypothetical protein
MYWKRARKQQRRESSSSSRLLLLIRLYYPMIETKRIACIHKSRRIHRLRNCKLPPLPIDPIHLPSSLPIDVRSQKSLYDVLLIPTLLLLVTDLGPSANTLICTTAQTLVRPLCFLNLPIVAQALPIPTLMVRIWQVFSSFISFLTAATRLNHSTSTLICVSIRSRHHSLSHHHCIYCTNVYLSISTRLQRHRIKRSEECEPFHQRAASCFRLPHVLLA